MIYQVLLEYSEKRMISIYQLLTMLDKIWSK